ncbi:MAG: hypothetical protein ACKO6N_28180 [Myxococcota bacterium]
MMSRLFFGMLIAVPLSFGASSQLESCGGEMPTPTPSSEPTIPPGGTCGATGCSGQICAWEPVASTCEYTCEYGCYQYATCEAQSTNICGWTSSPEFEACLDKCKAGGLP